MLVYMWQLTLFNDENHDEIISTDNYKTIKEIAYILGVPINRCYSFRYYCSRPRSGIFKYISLVRV